MFIKNMSSGVPILDTVTKKCVVEKIDDNTFRIILTQGLNRQIRRMCEKCGLTIMRLTRISVGKLKLGDLERGAWRKNRFGPSWRNGSNDGRKPQKPCRLG